MTSTEQPITIVFKPEVPVFHPDSFFFDDAAHKNYSKKIGDSFSKNVGFFDPPDISLSLVASIAQGNIFTYHHTGTNTLFQPFLVGEVIDIQSLPGVDSQANNLISRRICIRQLQNAAGHVANHFFNDALLLNEVMKREEAYGTGMGAKWLQHEGNDAVISVDCGNHTEIVNGEISKGSSIIADVTMHRRDLYIAGIRFKFYTLAAHRVECVSTEWLSEAGLVAARSLGDIYSDNQYGRGVDDVAEILQATNPFV